MSWCADFGFPGDALAMLLIAADVVRILSGLKHPNILQVSTIAAAPGTISPSGTAHRLTRFMRFSLRPHPHPPVWNVTLNSAADAVHVAPFLCGLLAHSSTSMSQFPPRG